MLAMLGLTVAGAGVMKSQTAIAKQKELENQKSQELAGLQAQLDAQKADASANWEQNLAMQANAKQIVMTQVTQSQANKDFWVAYAVWKAKAALAEAKRRARELAKKKQQPLIVNKPLNPKGKSTSSTSSRINPLALVLSVIIVGTGLLLGAVQNQPNTKPEDFRKPPTESVPGTECYRQLAQFPGMFDEAFCTVVSTVEALININELTKNLSDVLNSLGGGSSSNSASLEEHMNGVSPYFYLFTDPLQIYEDATT